MSQLGTYNFASIESLTGDVGGPVFPVASNIDVVGGVGVAVTGNPALGTLTIALTGGLPVVSFTTDIAGPVVPTGAGIVDINGGQNISTDGSVANRITFNVSGTTDHCVQLGNVTNSLTSMAVGLNGQTIMGATAADPGWTASPQFGGSVTALNDISSTAGSVVSLAGSLITRDATNTATGPSIYFQKVRVAAIVQAGDDLGTLRYTGYDGVGYITGAKITSTTSGTIGANRVAGDLKFWTHPDSVIALPSEPITRMTIGPAGNVTISNPDAGTALTINAGGFTVTAGATTLTPIASAAATGVVTVSNAGVLAEVETGAAGTIFVGTAGAPKFLAAGTLGYQLIAAGAAADPVWTIGSSVSLGTTQYAVLVGGAAGVVASLAAVGATGTVLVGNTGANPVFSASPNLTTVTSTTLRTGDPAVLAAITSINASTLTTDGTAANVDFKITPKGSGNFNFTGHTGTAMVFRGISPGTWTDIDWHTEQHVHQTVNTFAPEAIFSLVIPAKRMVTIKALVNGFQDDYSDVVGGEVMVTAYRDNAGGNLLLAGAPIINVNYSSLIDTSDINAGISGVDTINIYVVGVVAQTWNWAATIQYMYTVDNS